MGYQDRLGQIEVQVGHRGEALEDLVYDGKLAIHVGNHSGGVIRKCGDRGTEKAAAQSAKKAVRGHHVLKWRARAPLSNPCSQGKTWVQNTSL